MLDMMKKERDIFERRSIYHILVPASLNIKDHTAFSLLLLLLLLLLQWFNVCLQWKHSGIWFHYVFFSNCSFRVEKASKGSFKCNLRPHWGMHSYPNSVCFHSFTLKEPGCWCKKLTDDKDTHLLRKNKLLSINLLLELLFPPHPKPKILSECIHSHPNQRTWPHWWYW